MDREPQKCGDCRHWFRGDCRRFPPVMIPYPSDNQHPISYWPTPMFPTRDATDYGCGEFSRPVND